jgi:hypothetical protein
MMEEQMPVRTDGWSKSRPKGTGVWSFSGTLTIGGSYPILTERSVRQDNTSGPDNGPFTVNYFQLEGGLINGRQPDTTVWTNYLADAYENASRFGHLYLAESPDNFQAATEGAARTNPSRPSADIPANLLELGTLGSLMRAAPKTLREAFDKGLPHPFRNLERFAPNSVGEAASLNLYVNFGLLPILGDIQKCLQLKKIMNDRIKEIKRLHGAKGLRRTVTVWDGSTRAEGPFTAQSVFGFYSQPATVITTEQVRTHCRWFPAAEFLPWDHDDGDMVKQAYKAVLGLSLTQLDTYWEALPWSWLIDWMSTCGSYFRASRNIIPCSLPITTVMRHTKTEWSFGPSNTNGTAQVAPGRVIIEDKSRVLWPVFPSAHLAFLTKDQMGIVSSLAVQRL